MPEVVIIAAVAKNRVIGKDNRLLWNIPEDMAHFKALTGRRNIVISRQIDYAAPGAELSNSLENALKLASTSADAQSAGKSASVFVIGGEQIYAQAMNLADRLEITEVELEPDGDAWFPEIAAVNWKKTAKIEGSGYAFVTYKKK